MSKEKYDVVIVGAGQAGSILAKVISGAGRRVLLLEAGLEAGVDFDAGAAYSNYVGGYLDTFYNASAKVPNSPYPNLPNAGSPNVLLLGGFDRSKPPVFNDEWPPSQDANLRLTNGYFIQKGQEPFGSDYQRAPGGTMLHWLGSTPRMLPNDFRMYTKYGQGVDWPITYDELKPYYEMAEREIGVSGNVDELCIPGTDAETYGPGYSFPMRKLPQSYLDNQVAARVKGKRVTVNGVDYDLYIVPTPQGRNSTPDASYKYKNLEPQWDSRTGKIIFQKAEHPYTPVGSVWDPYTGQRCEGNASCVPICPVQAKYNALKTLKSALHDIEEHGGKGSITIIAQAVASNIEFDSEGRVKRIRYRRYSKPGEPDYVEGTAEGEIYVLAAHSVENAKLLLMSDACPGNLNVGRHLMDHTTMLAWGLMPEWSGAYRGPGSTSNFPIFRDGPFRERHAAWISPVDNWGWNWPALSPDADVVNALNGVEPGIEGQRLFGRKLRAFLRDRIPRQVNMHFEVEQLPDWDNRVTINPRFRDQLGIPRPVVTYDMTQYTVDAFYAARQVASQIFSAAGVKDFSIYNEDNPKSWSHGAGHLAGTHRMGTSPNNSVVDRRQRTWAHENLYLAGCGNMPTIGTSNPTLTMSALAFWAAENILQDLAARRREVNV
jgi:choline dehydrogenase-like flavoprotein